MINIIAVTVMIEALSKPQGATRPELHEITGLDRKAICRWINAMHDRPKPVIYIGSWEKACKNTIARYHMGYMVDDTPRPAPKSRSMVERDYRENKHIRLGHGPKGQRNAVISKMRADNVRKQPRDEKHRLTKEVQA